MIGCVYLLLVQVLNLHNKIVFVYIFICIVFGIDDVRFDIHTYTHPHTLTHVRRAQHMHAGSDRFFFGICITLRT